jgi:beta-lactamase regulating signal transducer with metallopeptidase domain
MPPASAPSIGTSIVLIAIGAILKYAVSFSVSGIDINVVGTILLLVGILGLVIALAYTIILTNRRREPEVTREREYYDEPTRRRY